MHMKNDGWIMPATAAMFLALGWHGNDAAYAQAPCQLQWSDQFPAVTDGYFNAVIEFDDGSGPALFVGGGFNHILGMPIANIARRDSNGTWTATGCDLPREDGVSAFVVFDEGSGPALYAGGSFYSRSTSVLKWTGTAWVDVGAPEGQALSFAVYDDGGGAALYAAGFFPSSEPGAPFWRILRWSGREWNPLPFEIANNVNCLQVFDDGRGPLLYVGGEFTGGGGPIPPFLATWDGTNWESVGKGVNGPVTSMAVMEEDKGINTLCVGGSFTEAGGIPAARVASWDGRAWSNVGSGLQSAPECIEAVALDRGVRLLAGGKNLLTPLDSNVVMWDGATWASLTSGLGSVNSPSGSVHAIHAVTVADGEDVVAVGGFDSRFAEYDGESWSLIGGGLTPNAFTSSPFGLNVVRDPNTGDHTLCVFGGFSAAGTVDARAIALWNGQQWSALGSGISTIGPPVLGWIGDVESFADANGPGLCVGGWFNRAGGLPVGSVARWDGKHWSSMDPPFGKIWDLAVFDDGSGPALFAGGSIYLSSIGSVVFFSRWGESQWGFVPAPVDFSGHALQVLVDSRGEALFAARPMQLGPGQIVCEVFRWDGQEFEQLEGQFTKELGSPSISAFAMYLPSGQAIPRLVVAGDFEAIDGVPVSRIAEWDGRNWTELGSGINGVVRSLCVFDDGHGPALYAAGDFTQAGTIDANSIARWDGATWTTLGNGFDGDPTNGGSRAVHELAVFDDGAGGGPALFAIGKFRQVDGLQSSQIARWGRLAPPQPGDATGDCTVNINDLLAVINNWGTSDAAADLDHDGTVEIDDLLLVLLNWGGSSG